MTIPTAGGAKQSDRSSPALKSVKIDAVPQWSPAAAEFFEYAPGGNMVSAIRHLHLSSRDHAASQRFYEKYFEFHFDSVFPRDDRIDLFFREPHPVGGQAHHG